MTPQRRELMMRVMDNHYDLLLPKYMYFFDKMVRCDDILRWLIKARWTRKEFMEAIEHHFKHSPFQMGKYILSEIDRELETRRTMHRKEFI